MYNDYLNCRSENIGKNFSTCGSFDEYLYFKIQHDSDELICRTNKVLESSEKLLCRAWEPVVSSLEIEINFVNVDRTKEVTKQRRSKSYLKDVETIMHWLLSKINLKNADNKHFQKAMKLPYLPFERDNTNDDVVNMALCYMTTFSMNVFTLKNDCLKILRRTH